MRGACLEARLIKQPLPASSPPQPCHRPQRPTRTHTSVVCSALPPPGPSPAPTPLPAPPTIAGWAPAGVHRSRDTTNLLGALPHAAARAWRHGGMAGDNSLPAHSVQSHAHTSLGAGADSVPITTVPHTCSAMPTLPQCSAKPRTCGAPAVPGPRLTPAASSNPMLAAAAEMGVAQEQCWLIPPDTQSQPAWHMAGLLQRHPAGHPPARHAACGAAQRRNLRIWASPVLCSSTGSAPPAPAPRNPPAAGKPSNTKRVWGGEARGETLPAARRRRRECAGRCLGTRSQRLRLLPRLWRASEAQLARPCSHQLPGTASS